MEPRLIELRDIHYSYKSHRGSSLPALAGVDIEFRPRELTVLFGHNGSGKSTLAKHLNGLLRPDRGEVGIDGLDPSDEEQLWRVRQKVGLVFQNPDNQIVASVVEDDVAFGPENLGIAPPEIQARVDRVMAMLGIEHLKNSEPHFLSSGDKQLVAIAGVLTMDPRYVVLDEPTSLLPPEARAEVVSIAGRLAHEEELGVVLITHLMDEAVQADRVVVMDRGRVVEDGSPREVFAKVERLRALSLDVPVISQIAHQLRARHGLRLRENLLTVEELVGQLVEGGILR